MTPSADEIRQANTALWNEWAMIHERSAVYDVPGFIQGKSSLHAVELEEVGVVSGKSLLHLQCHIGLDTLSWARLGAIVTGVDFSPAAISVASRVSAEANIPADFVCCDLYDLQLHLNRQFDIVFTSYGVLCWLPDLERWAALIARNLRPGGFFYIAELHPLAAVFDADSPALEPRLRDPYFQPAEPVRWEGDGTYAEPHAQVRQREHYEWAHTLGEVVTALAGAGLDIEFLHEFPYCVEGTLGSLMERGDDGWYRLKNYDGYLPLMFSIKARKPR